MAWFTSWWDNLSLLQQYFALAAIPGTIILFLQTIMLLFSFGSDDMDAADDGDLDSEMDFDQDGVEHTSGIRILTVRGLVAFFAVGGWLGIAMIDLGADSLVATLIALLGGFVALASVAYILKLSLKLQESGNINIKNAVARTATVYITIPKSRIGTGKVTLTLQERFIELDAVTDSEYPIKVGTMVQVISVFDNQTLLVRPLTNTAVTKNK